MNTITFKLFDEDLEPAYTEHDIFLTEQGYIYLNGVMPENRVPEEFLKGMFLEITVGAACFRVAL